jgi:outer membrane protein OmpA-like peptidoglycan-associated protein
LYFSSDRPGGLGGSDIYYSTKDKKGRWRKGKNLGSVINTPFNDDGPFIDFSGKYLYFSSEGHKGMGGYDIFQSEYDSVEEVWKEPVNLGFPINTPDNDIYYVATDDNKTGYYATVRDGGFGLSDIYMIREGKYVPPEDTTEKDEVVMSKSKDTTSTDVSEPPVRYKNIILTLRVKNQNDELISARVKAVNTENQLVAAQKKIRDGVYKFKIEDAGNAVYRISVEKDGYTFINEDMTFNASPDQILEIEKVVNLSPLSVGTSQVLRNIYFDFNKANLKPSSFEELSKVENLLAKNPSIEIELGGHTDNIGDDSFNKDLSQRRVDAVKKYLVNKGVDPRRIQAVGYGEEKPLATNDDEREGRELNRRVEFTVLKN